MLAARGVQISPLRPANSGFTVAWSDIFRDRFEGQPLKGVALTFGAHSVRGEAIVTRTGIEGGAVYALSAELREAIDRGRATLHVALRPDLDMKELIAKVSAPKGKQSLSNFLRKAVSLSPVAIGLLQEAAKTSGASLASLSPAELARLINAVPIELTGVAPIARAISTAGGIRVQRNRCRFHAPPLARRVCGRRNAGLGSADRRLSAAGVVRDGRSGGAGCVEVARSNANPVMASEAKRCPSLRAERARWIASSRCASAHPTRTRSIAASPAPPPAACR